MVVRALRRGSFFFIQLVCGFCSEPPYRCSSSAWKMQRHTNTHWGERTIVVYCPPPRESSSSHDRSSFPMVVLESPADCIQADHGVDRDRTSKSGSTFICYPILLVSSYHLLFTLHPSCWAQLLMDFTCLAMLPCIITIKHHEKTIMWENEYYVIMILLVATIDQLHRHRSTHAVYLKRQRLSWNTSLFGVPFHTSSHVI